MNGEYAKQTALKWFDILELPADWRSYVESEFELFDLEAIERAEKPYAYLFEQEDKLLCLCYALYKCEEFFENGKSIGISEDILIESLAELKRHACNYNRSSKGEKIGLYQIKWIGNILSGKIYCLGRLEFEMTSTKRECEKLNVTSGDKVLNVHIPRSGKKLDPESVDRSFSMAKEFFEKYFPNHNYKCFACHSWLLDPTLKEILGEGSNIVHFLNRFEIVETTESESALRIAFGSNATCENLNGFVAETSLQKAFVEHVNKGGKFYMGYGFMAK